MDINKRIDLFKKINLYLETKYKNETCFLEYQPNKHVLENISLIARGLYGFVISINEPKLKTKIIIKHSLDQIGKDKNTYSLNNEKKIKQYINNNILLKGKNPFFLFTYRTTVCEKCYSGIPSFIYYKEENVYIENLNNFSKIYSQENKINLIEDFIIQALLNPFIDNKEKVHYEHTKTYDNFFECLVTFSEMAEGNIVELRERNFNYEKNLTTENYLLIFLGEMSVFFTIFFSLISLGLNNIIHNDIHYGNVLYKTDRDISKSILENMKNIKSFKKNNHIYIIIYDVIYKKRKYTYFIPHIGFYYFLEDFGMSYYSDDLLEISYEKVKFASKYIYSYADMFYDNIEMARTLFYFFFKTVPNGNINNNIMNSYENIIESQEDAAEFSDFLINKKIKELEYLENKTIPDILYEFEFFYHYFWDYLNLASPNMNKHTYKKVTIWF